MTLDEALKEKGLTQRQIEVCELVAKGLSNKEVANQLFITEQTVKVHLISIYKIAGFKSRAQLIIYCLPLLGWVSE
ncbi:MAG: helix-turn-helix domain-containing protein [Pseudobdellovibrionaceae bacterium]